MCCIAEVLITLQQEGNVKYIGWSIIFPCETVTIEYLEKEAKEMEGELDRWIKEVAEARSTFHELNYYTTQQLLVLRGELVKVKMSDTVTPSYHMTQVITLLQSISSKITASCLQGVVKGISLQKNKPLLNSLSLVNSFERTLPVETPSTTPVCNSEPNTTLQLSVEELNVDQKMWYNNIIEILRYHESIALRAIKEVGHGDWNDIERWLAINAESESDVLCEKEDEESGNESGDEVTTEQKYQDLPAG